MMAEPYGCSEWLRLLPAMGGTVRPKCTEGLTLPEFAFA